MMSPGLLEPPVAAAAPPRPPPARRDLGYHLAAQRGPLVALAIFVVMFAFFVGEHPAGFSANVVNTAANKGALLAFVAMAQTIPVLTSGIDLSVGMVFVLTNCLASTVVSGSPLATALGVAAVLGTGLLCGALNGALVVLGRLQPSSVPLATGSIYFGGALWLRPAPGGAVHEGFADFMTGSLAGGVPFSLVLLAAAVLVFWLPYRRSIIGRAAYAIGSSEQAAYMSGVSIAPAKFLTYVMAGLFSAIAGLLLTCLTYSGEANAALGGAYTLNSIAAVVLGGTSLFGGSGGAVGSILGAFVLRTIGDLLFVLNLDPLWQPLFLGVVLLVGLVFLGWLPYRRSVIGRAAYAVGSSEQAAYMSGVPVARAKFLTYVLAGLFSAIAGLLLTCLTESGEANAMLGGGYTLSSIAAVVVGGTSLFGGSGGAVGSIFGAFVLRTIGDLLFVFNMDPLWQPLFLGVVLLLAVGVGSLRLLRVKNRLDLFR